MPERCRTFWLARRGSSASEYEDAFAADEAAGRFALADGATEGCFTGVWARLLVEGFVSDPGREVADWSALLPALQERWHAEVRTPHLPWYVEQGIRDGAFATFLGVILSSPSLDEYHWQAVAVGDTCLLHTCDNTLLGAFPIDRAVHFSNFPKLVSSRMSVESVRTNQDLLCEGRARSGDCLWMMTDALAQWCLGEVEAGRNPWRELESLLTPPDDEDRFLRWIEGLRDAGRLRNDDVTLLVIDL